MLHSIVITNAQGCLLLSRYYGGGSEAWDSEVCSHSFTPAIYPITGLSLNPPPPRSIFSQGSNDPGCLGKKVVGRGFAVADIKWRRHDRELNTLP